MALYDEISKMKNIIRQGWIVENVSINNRFESDAEHTFSTILLALEIIHKEQLNLDQAKVMKMLAFHDLCEIDNGDLLPFEGISKSEKYNKELRCIKRLSKQYNMPEILELWLEFSENETPEAKFVKKIDRLDFIMQAKQYSRQCKKPELLETVCGNYPELTSEFKKYIEE